MVVSLLPAIPALSETRALLYRVDGLERYVHGLPDDGHISVLKRQPDSIKRLRMDTSRAFAIGGADRDERVRLPIS